MDKGEHAFTNQLIHTSSPYLLQHAHNPVNWYPWGEEALEKAKKEDKLLIISIGYAACHWCHVMEHESFEDTSVARLMNDNFVSIKIDREERPDIDQIYMDAAMLINQRGGWPLNAIALPDGRPIFAGTYYPTGEWKRVLNFFKDVRDKQPEEVEKNAESISRGISRMNFAELAPRPSSYTTSQTTSLYNSLISQIDTKRGGLNNRMKFPMPIVWQYLLEHHYYSGDQEALSAVTTTLKEMLDGGIYDQLGGGFARYSTDPNWKVPHFEKMMYDNGQLVSLYAKAYQMTKNPSFKTAVKEITEWVAREMTHKNGGFYSSLDADSDGEEGKFYVWEENEIDSLLGDKSELFKSYYNISGRGNWEGKNILLKKEDLKEVAAKLKIDLPEAQSSIAASKEILLAARDSRIRPGLDDKILTSWNALMLRGYVDAYQALGEQTYLEAALKNASFILEKAKRKDGGLNRNFKDEVSTINGFADDYSLTIEAFIALYQATFDEKWLFEAEALMEYALTHFYDKETGTFFYTSDEDPSLIARSREIQDNVIPSSNSSFGRGLFALGTYLYKGDYLEKAEQILAQALPQMKGAGPYFANYGLLLNRFVHTPYEVAMVGDQAASFARSWNEEYHAGVFLLGGKEEGKLELLQHKLVPGATFIYVCQDKVCKLPVEEVDKAMDLIK